MLDKTYLPPSGEGFTAEKKPDSSFKVLSPDGKIHEVKNVLPEATNFDHQTKRLYWTKGNRRGVYWIYQHKNRRIFSWPGGSLELEAQDYTDQAGSASNALKPLKLTMPGKVLAIKVKEGDLVDTGQGLIVVEAMKMENILMASAPAKIKKIHVQVGDRLESGSILITFDSL